MNPLLQPSGLAPGGTLGAPSAPADKIQLGWPGLDPLHDSLDILIFDDSGSITGEGGNDPIGNRYVEAREAVKVVGAWSTSPRQRVAVLHFDYPYVPMAGPHHLHQRGGRAGIAHALRVPLLRQGSSSLVPAIMAANKLTREEDAAEFRCTIFSDFELLDTNPSQPYEEIARFPGYVHAVVMNADPPAALLAITNVTITRIETDSPPGMAAATLMHSLTTSRRGARRSSLRHSRPSKT